MNDSYNTAGWIVSHRRMSHVTHTWMNLVTQMNESCHTDKWIMRHRWTSHVTHMKESYLHIWMHHTPPLFLAMWHIWKSPICTYGCIILPRSFLPCDTYERVLFVHMDASYSLAFPCHVTNMMSPICTYGCITLPRSFLPHVQIGLLHMCHMDASLSCSFWRTHSLALSCSLSPSLLVPVYLFCLSLSRSLSVSVSLFLSLPPLFSSLLLLHSCYLSFTNILSASLLSLSLSLFQSLTHTLFFFSSSHSPHRAANVLKASTRFIVLHFPYFSHK